MLNKIAMKFPLTCLEKALPLVLLIMACSLLISCGESGITKTMGKPYHAIADLIPRRVPVTEVRPEDLRKLPTGEERAREWDRRLDAKRYAFALRNYQAPKLPDSRSLPTSGGLLPPLDLEPDSNLEGRGKLPPN
jgi:hypothetical protein